MGFFDSLGSMFKSSKKDVTQTSNSSQSGTSTMTLPDWQQSLIQSQIGNVSGMPGYSSVAQAPRNPSALAAEQFAGGANTENLGAANNYNQAVLGGEFMGRNPFLDQTFDQAAGRVSDQFTGKALPGIASMFSGAGRYGGQNNAMGNEVNRAAQNYGDTMNNLATNIYGGAYNTERGAMEAAAGRAPGLNSAGYEGARVQGTLGALGDQYGLQGAALGQSNQLMPWQIEAMRTGQLAGDYGGRTTNTTGTGTGSNTTPYFGPSPFETGAGILSTGASLLSGGLSGMAGMGGSFGNSGAAYSGGSSMGASSGGNGIPFLSSLFGNSNNASGDMPWVSGAGGGAP